MTAGTQLKFRDFTGAYYKHIKGITPKNGSKYLCCLKDHEESVPSMVFHKDHFYCHGCRTCIDLITLIAVEHNLDEAKELDRKQIFKIANEFCGFKSTYQIDEKEIKKERCFDAIASKFQSNLKNGLPFLTQEQAEEYGVGTLDSIIPYLTSKDIKLFDLTPAKFKELFPINPFNSNKLTFLIKDATGVPIGFLCRNLNFEQTEKAWRALPDQAKTQHPAPTKYIKLFKSSSTVIYNMDEIRKNKHLINNVYVVESQKAVIYLRSKGIENAVAILSSCLNKDQLEALIAADVKRLTLVPDNDERGYESVLDTMKLLVKLRTYIDIEVLYPQGPPHSSIDDLWETIDDIEEYLQPMALFNFIKKYYKIENDIPVNIYKILLKYCNLTPTNYKKDRLLDLLSITFKIPLTSVKEDSRVFNVAVNEQVIKSSLKELKDEITALGKIKDFENIEPNEVISKVQQTVTTLLNKTSQSTPFSQEAGYNETLEIFSENENGLASGITGFKTGLSLFDKSMDGIPRKANLMIIGGYPNTGKSAFCLALAVKLLQNNENIMLGYVTLDDTKAKAIARITSNLSGLKSVWCEQFNKYIKPFPNRIEPYEQAKEQITRWQDPDRDCRLNILAGKDAKTPEKISAFAQYLQEYSKKDVLLIVDGFHNLSFKHYASPGSSSFGAEDMAAKFFRDDISRYNYSMILTAECRKAANSIDKRRVRPTMEDISGSKGLIYAATFVAVLWSEYFAVGTSQEKQWANWTNDYNEKQPQMEFIIDKNKMPVLDSTAKRTTVYYNFDSTTTAIYDCDPRDYKSQISSKTSSEGQLGGVAGW